jgi:hypothetical protein
MKVFSADGLSFSYPDNWRIEREPGDEGWTVSLQSPGTAFAVVQLISDMSQTREDVAQTALDALKDEYPTLEAEPSMDMLAGDLAVGHDMQFFSLDFANTCWTRCFHGLSGLLFVMCQVSDIDQEAYEPGLRGICASMRLEED